ncbi:MAG TPA: Kiwa anti-phage protein KwaB-like domain-containing protein [Ktedonobacteraceae bacterium]|nr:Kiwa anti-phage protein KwaB-like domain-containing protein [Ktedonobacteraceae bacterium]
MIAPITTSHIDVFDEIIALDLDKCVITVCMASTLKDEAPRFARVSITTELANGFRDTIKNLTDRYKQNDHRQLSMFPGYVEDSSPAVYDIPRISLSQHQTIPDQLVPLKALTDIDEFDRDEKFISGLRFYVIIAQPPIGEPVYFFSTYTRKRMLEHTFVYAIFRQGIYDRITDPVLQFDQDVDCMCRGDTMFIFNQKGFENIFHFFDEIRQIAAQALDSIKACVPIKNFDEFVNDCGRHIWKQRKLKKIASKPYLSRITMDHIKKVIEHNNLPVQIDEEMLVYDPRDKWVILNLLDDNYLWSMLTELSYEATSKREI